MKQRFLDSLENAKDAIAVRKDRRLMDSAIKCGENNPNNKNAVAKKDSRTLSEVVSDTPLLSNPTFKSGCTDVLAVRLPNGFYMSTAFNLMYGKYRPSKVIENVGNVFLKVNGIPVKAVMKMEKDGCAYFRHPGFTPAVEDIRPWLIPTQEEFERMRLVPGKNDLEYTLMKEDGEKKVMNAMIYLVTNTDKLIVSDIDGTITRSDMRGHVFNALGCDWSQVGVTKLYSELHSRGYHFVYLTSRSIEAAQGTREYINTLEQKEKTPDGRSVTYKLPTGPVFTSSFRFFKAVNNELIRKVPQEFKIACLSEVASLFPGTNPLYAGFGNKPTDLEAYSKVGICSNRIFIVDKSARLTCFEGIDGRQREISYTDIAESKAFPRLEVPQQAMAMPQRSMSQGPGGMAYPQMAGQGMPQGYPSMPQGYSSVSPGYPQAPQGYQQGPQGYSSVPPGYPSVSPGYSSVSPGYPQGPQGYSSVQPSYSSASLTGSYPGSTPNGFK